MMLSEYMTMFPGLEVEPFLIGAIIGALISAFFGFRLFKLSLIFSFATTGYALGYSLFGLVFGEGVEGLGFDGGIVVGLACAIILALLAVKLYKALVYSVGGMFGVLIGFVIPYFILEAFNQQIIGIVLGLVCAAVLAILFAKGFMKLMKPIIIIETALYGMAIACEAVAMLLTSDETVIGLASIAGLVLGIFAAKYQFKANEGRQLFDND